MNQSQSSLWKLEKGALAQKVSGFDVNQLTIADWQYGQSISTFRFVLLSSDAEMLLRDHQSPSVLAADEPKLHLLSVYNHRFMVVTDQRHSLDGVLKFSSGRTVVISSHFDRDLHATPSGKYFYAHELGDNEVHRLSLSSLHPEVIGDGLSLIHRLALSSWEGTLPTPFFEGS